MMYVRSSIGEEADLYHQSLVCGDLSKKTEMTCDLVTSFIEQLNNN